MKKKLSLLILIFSSFLVACGQVENDNKTVENKDAKSITKPRVNIEKNVDVDMTGGKVENQNPLKF